MSSRFSFSIRKKHFHSIATLRHSSRKQSYDLLSDAHHSGIFGPVHTASPTSSRFYLHYAQGGVGSLAPTLRLRCRPGVFHRSAAPLRRPFRAVPSSLAIFLLLLSPVRPFFPGSAAGHRSGSPYILVYVFYYTSTGPTGSLAVGWVFSHCDTMSLLRSFTVLGLRFDVLYFYQGCLVDSRRRHRARTARPGTWRSRCSTKGMNSPPRFTTSRLDAISFKGSNTLEQRIPPTRLVWLLFSAWGPLFWASPLPFSPPFLSLSLCSLFFCVRCLWFVGLVCGLLCVGLSCHD